MFCKADEAKPLRAVENMFMPVAMPCLPLLAHMRVHTAGWIQDWAGPENLPPALIISDQQGRAHIFGINPNFTPTVKWAPALDSNLHITPKGSLSKILKLRGSRPSPLNDRTSSPKKRSPKESFSADDQDQVPEEFEVELKSDSEFGLGLLIDFKENRAYVKGFKPHPKTGAKLPAEASGAIQENDEIIAINKYRIEGLDRAGAIQVVKEKGSQIGGTVVIQVRSSTQVVPRKISVSSMNDGTSAPSTDVKVAGLPKTKDRGAAGGTTDGALGEEFDTFEATGFWEFMDTVTLGFPLEKKLVLPYMYPLSQKGVGATGTTDKGSSIDEAEVASNLRWAIVVGLGRPEEAEKDVLCAWEVELSCRPASTDEQLLRSSSLPDMLRPAAWPSMKGKGPQPTGGAHSYDQGLSVGSSFPDILSLTSKRSSSNGESQAPVWRYSAKLTELARIFIEEDGKKPVQWAPVQSNSVGAWFVASSSDGWVRRYSLCHTKKDLSLETDVWTLHTQDLFQTESDSPISLLCVASTELIAVVHQREEFRVQVYVANTQFPREFLLETNLDLSTSVEGEEGWVPYSGYVPLRVSAMAWMPRDDAAQFTLCCTDGWRVRLFNRMKLSVDPTNPSLSYKWEPILEVQNPACLLPSPTGGLTEWLYRYLSRTGAETSKKDPLLEMTTSDWHPLALVSLLCSSGWDLEIAKGRIVQVLDWVVHEATPLTGGFEDYNTPQEVAAKVRKGLVVPVSNFLAQDEKQRSNDKLKALAKLADDLQGHAEQFLASVQAEIKKYADEELGPYDADPDLLKQEETKEKVPLQPLPSLLAEMSDQQMLQLWAVLEVVVKDKPTGNMDWLAHLFLISRGFLSCTLPQGELPNIGEHISSAAVLAALLSPCQDALIDTVCPPSSGLTWAWARALRVSFWVRSHKTLRRITEDIASTEYRANKDPMQVAIFYLALGKKATLLQLAKLDKGGAKGSGLSGKLNYGQKDMGDSQSSGAKLAKLLAIDLATPRGRSAVEKNAFVLLRKRQYGPAAAVFLLTQPPMLGEALHIIFTHLKDTTLGLLVIRLMGPACVEQNTNSAFILDAVSRAALQEHVIPQLETKHDIILTAATYHWLQDHRRARESLAAFDPLKGELIRSLGYNRNSSGSNLSQMGGRSFQDFSSAFGGGGEAQKNVRLNTAMREMNDWMDQTLFPFLVHEMNGRGLTLWKATMNAARIMAENGLEVPSLVILEQMQRADQKPPRQNFFDPSEKFQQAENFQTPLVGGLGMANSLNTGGGFGGMMRVPPQPGATDGYGAGSSFKKAPADPEMDGGIFGNWNAPSQKKVTPMDPEMDSGIFGGFNAPIQKITAPSDPGLDSGIFGGFNAPLAQKKTTVADPGVDSGIFGGFDIPPPASQKKSAPIDPGMDSGIFGGFDVPTPAIQKKNAPADPGMDSGIFGGFDVPQPAIQKKSAPSDPGMDSGIFGGFDVPQQKKVTLTDPGIDNDIFEKFTGPSQKKRVSIDPEISSGIFGGFDVPTELPNIAVSPSRSSYRTRTHSIEEVNSGSSTGGVFSNFDDVPPVRSKTPSKGAPEENSSWQNGSLDPGAPMRGGNPMNIGKKERGDMLISRKQAVEKMQSSIFDDFSPVPQARNTQPERAVGRFGGIHGVKENEEVVESLVEKTALTEAMRWEMSWWLQQQVYMVAARRLLREANHFLQGLDLIPPERPQMLVVLKKRVLGIHHVPESSSIPPSLETATTKEEQAGLSGLVSWIDDTAQRLSQSFELDWCLLLAYSLRLLRWPEHRLVVACLLLQRLNKADTVAMLVSSCAHRLIQRCCSQYNETFNCQNVQLNKESDSYTDMNVLANTKELHQLVWQLELCLWLHSCNTLPLILGVHSEAVVAVRIGILLQCWGQDYHVLYDMIKHPPDTSNYTGDSLQGVGFEEENITVLHSIPIEDEEEDNMGSPASAKVPNVNAKLSKVFGAKSVPSPSMVISEPTSPTNKSERSGQGWEYFREAANRQQAEEALIKAIPGTFLIREHELDKDAYTISFATGERLPQKPVRHLAVRIVTEEPLRLRCGEVGPCHGMQELLYLIASALPTGLVFDEFHSKELIKAPHESYFSVDKDHNSLEAQTTAALSGTAKDAVLPTSIPNCPNGAFLRSLALHRRCSLGQNGTTDATLTAVDYYQKGEVLIFQQGPGEPSEEVTVQHVHFDDLANGPYYTVSLKSDGREKQAIASKLRKPTEDKMLSIEEGLMLNEVWKVEARVGSILDMLILRCLHHHLNSFMCETTMQNEKPPIPARLLSLLQGTENLAQEPAPRLTRTLSITGSENAFGTVGHAMCPLLNGLRQWAHVINRQFYTHLHKRIMQQVAPRSLPATRILRAESQRSRSDSMQAKTHSSTMSFHMLSRTAQRPSFTQMTSFGDKADDLLVRQMVSKNSGINFHTVRKGGTGTKCPTVVCFFASEAAEWLHRIGFEESHQLAFEKLRLLEAKRIIERVEIQDSVPNQNQNVFYRFVDEWEVEPLTSANGGILRKGFLGRTWYTPASSKAAEGLLDALLQKAFVTNVSHIWSLLRGESWLIKTVAGAHYPCAPMGGEELAAGIAAGLDPYSTCISKYLYRSLLFTRLKMPHRYMVLVQVELADLKKLSPAPSLQKLEVYAVIRLQRRGSSVVLSNKTRTLDSIMTQPKKLMEDVVTHTNVWGGKAAFRFALPEAYLRLDDTTDYRHVVNRGPPKVLHVCVYSKNFLADTCLGDVEIPLAALTDNNKLDEWLPLRSEKGTAWFLHVKLGLKFVLMCAAEPDISVSDELHRDAGRSAFTLRRIMDDM